jgi:HEPN domain-containing protein
MNDPDQRNIQWTEALRWLAKADEDLRVAAMTLSADPPLIDPAAYHCQQAVEKLIKALLVAAEVKVPRTHDIESLADKAAPLYPMLRDRMYSFVHLTEWLTASRYPDLGGGLSDEIDDVTDMVAAVKEFYREVQALAPKAQSLD